MTRPARCTCAPPTEFDRLAPVPEEVSTIAGLGGMFVTGWQSKSQITARYGQLANAVLSGHRSKVIFPGTDDPSTLDYVSRIGGTVPVTQRGQAPNGLPISHS